MTKETFDQIAGRIAKMKSVSVSTLHDSFGITGSIARRLINHFANEGKIVRYGTKHHSQYLYTGVEAKPAEKTE